MRTSLAILTAAAALSLGACADDVYAGGGLALGYDAPYMDTCWSDGWYDPAYGMPICGWYDGYFYPGAGVYVYDRDHRRHAWTPDQQRFWTTRQQASAAGTGVVQPLAPRVAPQPSLSIPVPGAGMRGDSGRFGGSGGGFSRAMPRPGGGGSGRSR